MNDHRTTPIILVTVLLLAFASASGAQVVLDRQVRAGDLILFPKVNDDKVFYYAPTRIRIPRKGGRPVFSFIRYVENQLGEGAAPSARDGVGGGILHAQVQLQVSEQELNRARRELGRLVPDAVIEGPVTYTSGTFALVSAVTNPEGQFTNEVVGIGTAPILEGTKASVSVDLTRRGAKVLWEAFETSSAPIAFTFEMDLDGYWSPQRATIEADLSRVYKHEAFEAAVSANVGPVLVGAEIEAAFDDLRESGAIRVTQMGENEGFERLVQLAYDKLLEAMFTPASQGDLQGLMETGPQESLLDRANESLRSEQDASRRRNDERRQRNEDRRREQRQAEASRAEAQQLEGRADELEERARESEREADAAEATLASLVGGSVGIRGAGRDGALLRSRDGTDGSARAGGASSEGAGADSSGAPADPTSEAPGPLGGAGASEENASDADPAEGSPSPDGDAPGESGAADAADGGDAKIAAARQNAERLRAQATRARSEADAARRRAETGRSSATTQAGGLDPVEPETEETVPSAQLMASYRMKEVRQERTFRIDLNKFTQGTLSIRFDENMEDLREFRDDDEMFRQFNLDDPFFRQREIAVFVDGLNGSDFANFVNFASVRLRKLHENGDPTLEEVRVDRRSFVDQANDFRMIYGWKGDEDRDRWLDYDYKTTWSFFGGLEIDGKWRTTSAGAINLAPPYQPRSISLDADPELIKEAKVRAITVRVYSALGDEEQVRERTLNAMRNELSGTIQILLPAGVQEYAYEIDWRLRGNRTVSSGRQIANSGVLFVDELPEE